MVFNDDGHDCGDRGHDRGFHENQLNRHGYACDQLKCAILLSFLVKNKVVMTYQ